MVRAWFWAGLLGLCLLACDETKSTDPLDVSTDGDEVLASDTSPPNPRTCGLLVCGEDEKCCDYACVDTSGDGENCGDCGVRCDTSEQCVSGACRCGDVSCEQGDVCCGEACVDTSADPENCGACGAACTLDEVCAAGQCACVAQDGALEVCGEDELCCPGVGCRNLETDPTSCGVCGVRCGGGEICSGRLCTCGDKQAATGAAVCAEGTSCCGFPAQCLAEDEAQCECGTARCGSGLACCSGPDGDSCARISSDDANCGACGVECGFAERCRSGSCVCQSGFEDCDGDFSNGCESRIAVDPSNCGACGSSCASGEVCNGSGRCAVGCQKGRTNCGGSCFDLRADRSSCGVCNSACASGEVCDGTGICGASCVVGFTECGEFCQDLLRDRSACGSCGNACGPGLVCDGTAVCALSCQVGLTQCDELCVNLQSYRLHCGVCGTTCPAGEVCDGSGQCATTCQAGLTDCGGSCVDLSAEFGHCGVCGNACQSGSRCEGGLCVPECAVGQAVCDGACIDVLSDAAHCGACGRVCAADEVCRDGVCAGGCPGTQVLCGSICADLTSDEVHCGGCDVGCPLGEVCSAGVCGADTGCEASEAACENVCVDLQRDRFNCGDCGTACLQGQRCAQGVCLCEPGILDDCDGNGTCETRLLLDRNNCGVCGQACDAGEVCVDGSCACRAARLDCVDPAERCETNTLLDEAHCGACGVVCDSSTGEECVSGVCRTRTRHRLASTGGTVCYVEQGGAVQCWGANYNGQRGDDYFGFILEREYVPGLDGSGARAVSVALSRSHGCAVLDTGEIRCWAKTDTQGLLGCGGCARTGYEPVTVSNISTAVNVSVGLQSSCAVLASGAVMCWGSGANGRLGNNGTASSNVPVPVTGLDGVSARATQLTSTAASHCALLDTGAVWCWGANDSGQLGTGTFGTDGVIPAMATGLDGATNTAISLGAVNEDRSPSVCAVLDDGGVMCWGENLPSGQSASKIGTGSFAANLGVPTLVAKLDGTSPADGEHALVAAPGNSHTCFALADGAVRCTGSYFGACSANSVDVAQLAPIEGISRQSELVSGDSFSCGLSVDANGDDHITCWGVNSVGQLGVPSDLNAGYPRANALLELTGVREVTMGIWNGCAILTDNTLWCWGEDPGTQGITQVPTQVAGITDVDSISMTRFHACVVTLSGAVQCWGDGSSGQLGGGATQPRTSAPVTAVGLDGSGVLATQVSAGASRFTCALLETGAVQCWGLNGDGQLGTGDTITSPAPLTVIGLDGTTRVVDITTGSAHTCALLDTGAVQCWGRNSYGELGVGDATPRRVPTPVLDIDGVTARAVSVTAASSQSCALLDDGSVRCWGRNHFGQLGDGTVSSRNRPVAVRNLDGTTYSATEIALGSSHSCALIDDGSVQCWGSNFGGAVGTLLRDRIKTPVEVDGIDASSLKVVSLSSGSEHNCAVMADATLRCWGSNDSAGLGVTVLSQSCPVVDVPLNTTP